MQRPENCPEHTELEGENEELLLKIIDVLKGCYDPEIPVNIFELGLIYQIVVSSENKVEIKMTLTSPSCPVAESLPPEVEDKIKKIEGVSDAKIEIIWEPTWDQSKMTEAAKLILGMM